MARRAHLPGPLGASLARFLGLGPLLDGAAEVQALREQVEALEAEQLRREVEWRETKDQVFRHLKRVQAVAGRSAPEQADPTRQQLLALKFRRES